MADLEVKTASHWEPLNIVDGIPQCRCCREPMVNVGPDRWMCAIGAKLQELMADYLERAESALARP